MSRAPNQAGSPAIIQHNLCMPSQIDGHGNFGSVDNDPAAAMRYTECRLQHFSSATFLADLDADTVDFTPNFDASQVSLHLRVCLGVHQSDNSIIVLLL